MTEGGIFIASVHYRVGYLKSFGVNWYVNFDRFWSARSSDSRSEEDNYPEVHMSGSRLMTHDVSRLKATYVVLCFFVSQKP